MCAIGQFDQDHPNVLRHRQKHFLQVGDFELFDIFKFYFIEFRYTLYQFGHSGAKTLVQIIIVVFGIFDHVVAEGGHQRFVVHPHVSQNAGYGYRVGNIRFTTRAELRGVGIARKHVGLLHQGNLLRRQVRTDLLFQTFK